MRYRPERQFYNKYKKAMKIENEINSGRLKRARERRLIIQAFKYVENGYIQKNDFLKFRTTKKTDIEKDMEEILKDVIYKNLI